MLFETTKEDILASKVLKPGWYIFEIKDYTEKSAKTDGSDLAEIKVVVTSGSPLGNGTPSTGVPVRVFISEKFKAENAITLFNVLAGKRPDWNEPVKVNMENVRGKKVKGYVVNGEYKGKPTNNIERFAPLDADAVASV